jgi:hypothetical protein
VQRHYYYRTSARHYYYTYSYPAPGVLPGAVPRPYGSRISQPR